MGTALTQGLPGKILHAGLVSLGIELPRHPLPDGESLRDQAATPLDGHIDVRWRCAERPNGRLCLRCGRRLRMTAAVIDTMNVSSSTTPVSTAGQ